MAEAKPGRAKRLLNWLKHISWKWWLALVLVVFVIPGLVFSLVVHLSTRGLTSSPNPVEDYDEAVARFGLIVAAEAELPLNPVAVSRLMTHGYRTERVIVLYHGLTNCPYQFEYLGSILFDQGYNVLIPRMPHHGMADRSSKNLSALKASALRDYADQTVDIARGLGERVSVMGLSAGGVVAAFIAQHRSDVDQAILIAPALGFLPLKGSGINKLAYVLIPLLPDFSTDPEEPPPPGRDHIYPGFSSRALGELMRLSAATFRAAIQSKPAVSEISLITSDSDGAINEFIAWNLITLWRAKGLVSLHAHEFPESLAIEHDMIDPSHPNQKIDIVYPVILDEVNGVDADTIQVQAPHPTNP